MKRLLLRLFNAPLMLLLICLGVAIQTSLFATYPLNWIQPDLLLLLLTWFTLKRDFLEGGILTLILGEVAELHSSAPSGVLLLSYMVIFLLVRLLARLIVIPDFNSWIRLTLVSSVIWKTTSLIVLAYLDKASSQWLHTLLHLIPGAVATAVAGIWIYPLLDRLDRWTHKNQQMEQRLSDDLRLVENEGI